MVDSVDMQERIPLSFHRVSAWLASCLEIDKFSPSDISKRGDHLHLPRLMHTKFFLSLAVWVSLTNLSLQAQSLFSDSFDEDRSADWIIYDDSVDGVSDATVQFAHD